MHRFTAFLVRPHHPRRLLAAIAAVAVVASGLFITSAHPASAASCAQTTDWTDYQSAYPIAVGGSMTTGHHRIPSGGCKDIQILIKDVEIGYRSLANGYCNDFRVRIFASSPSNSEVTGWKKICWSDKSFSSNNILKYGARDGYYFRVEAKAINMTDLTGGLVYGYGYNKYKVLMMY